MLEDIGNATEVLSFRLGGEEYALSILKVQKIRGYDAVTRIASAPDYLKGVINLRGLGTVGERMLILLDIDKLLSSEDMGLLAAARPAA